MTTNQAEQKQIFGSKPAPHVEVGSIWYNPKRGNCLRVERLYEANTYEDSVHGYVPTKWARCLSWRPSGDKGSKPQDIRLSKLIEYEPVAEIRVVLADGRAECYTLARDRRGG